MRRALRLRELWSWLPAFRAAAETEHLPSASERLHVTPSSISRAIRLLEDSLGAQLFDRQGRSMRLNRDGRALLSAVRDAMRILDETVSDITGQSLRGAVDISAPDDYVPLLVIPATAEVLSKHPELIPRLGPVASDDVVARLLRGRLDIALTDQPVTHPDVRLEALVTLEQGVFGTGDRFVASPTDSWPPSLSRRVVAEVSTLSEAAAMCAHVNLAAALPHVIAKAHGLEPHRSAPDIEPRTLFAIYRRPLRSHPRTDAVLDALRSTAARL